MARKKPQSISLLGRALVGASQEASAEGRKRRKSEKQKEKRFDYLKKGFKFVGDKILTQNNETFLQNENFYARNALVNSNIAENQKHIDRWDNRTAYKTGEASYWHDMASGFMTTLPEYETWKNTTNTSDFNTYMYTETSKLAEKMKNNAKTNYTEATARASQYGENPSEAFKNEVLKGRADNVWDAMAMPIVNLFSGKDGRSLPQASMEALEGEDGLVAQGKVNSKDVKTIFEKTGNFQMALQTAQQLTTFRKTIGQGIKGLDRANITYGTPFNANLPDGYGGFTSQTIMEGKFGTTPLGYFTLSGEDISDQIKNRDINKRASKMDEGLVDTTRRLFQSSISKKDYEVFKDFKDQEINAFDKDDRKEAVKKWDKNLFGKVAITSEILTERFGALEGWSENFAIKLSSQMHAEDIKLSYEAPWMSTNRFNRNRSLLAGSDHYNPFVALKALQTLGASDNVSQRLLNVNLESSIFKTLDSRKDVSHTPLQIESVQTLAEFLDLK